MPRGIQYCGRDEETDQVVTPVAGSRLQVASFRFQVADLLSENGTPERLPRCARNDNNKQQTSNYKLIQQILLPGNFKLLQPRLPGFPNFLWGHAGFDLLLKFGTAGKLGEKAVEELLFI
jgi:hypothetical protein